MLPTIKVHPPSFGQLEFCGSYIIGILPNERRIRQPLSCSLTVSLAALGPEALEPEAMAKENLESSAALLHSLLTHGKYPLLEHALGHSLLALHYQWQAIFAGCPQLRHFADRYTLSLSIAKPAALGYLATPAARAQLCRPIHQPANLGGPLTLPVAGIGMFRLVDEGTGRQPSSNVSGSASHAESSAEKVWRQGCHQLWWQPSDLEAKT